MTPETETAVAEELCESEETVAPRSSVETLMSFAASPPRVWETIKFYEEIEERPPLLLRMLLPVPIRTEGRVDKMGGDVECLYEGGHLLKRITRVEQGELYEFEVIKQELAVNGGLRLLGGRYALRELPGGQTEVTLETRYVSSKWPRWFWTPIERFVCHGFHRFLLRSMRRAAEQG